MLNSFLNRTSSAYLTWVRVDTLKRIKKEYGVIGNMCLRNECARKFPLFTITVNAVVTLRNRSCSSKHPQAFHQFKPIECWKCKE
jgi:hypothetical protein